MDVRLTKRKNILLVLLIAVISVMLSACSVKKIMPAKEATQHFNTVTESLLETQKIVEKFGDSKKVKLSKKDMQTISSSQSAIQDAEKSLANTNVRMGYQAQVYDYSKAVDKYISVASDNPKDVDTLMPKYHAVVKKMIRVYKQMPESAKSSKTDKLIDTVEMMDPTYIKQAIKDQKKKKKEKSAESASKIKGKSITTGMTILIFILSGLLIISVFMQPSKADDQMNALTDTAGAGLMNDNKPRGYALYMMRTTEVCLALLVIVLLILEFKD